MRARGILARSAGEAVRHTRPMYASEHSGARTTQMHASERSDARPSPSQPLLSPSKAVNAGGPASPCSVIRSAQREDIGTRGSGASAGNERPMRP